MLKEQESRLKILGRIMPKFISIKPLLQGSLLGLLLVLTVIGAKAVFDPKYFPVLSVKISGDLRFQEKNQIQAVLLTELSKGFYGLSVNKLKKSLLNLSWIESAEVKRLWPDMIQVALNERKPLVIWNQAGFISNKGDLFVAKYNEEMASLENLPKLEGPEDRHSLVWQNYLVMEKVLEPTGLKISKLTLSSRGSWEMNLENKLNVILGTREVLTRLRRFVRAYDKLSCQLMYVDLRYTSGMAVGCENNNVSWLGRG